MKRKLLTFKFKVVESLTQTKDASEDCTIEGFANTSDKDRVGDVVMPSAFEKSLPTYMDNPVLLANHDWNDPCGVVTTAEIQEKGLFVRAKISATRADIKTLIREGVLRTFSIGYNELDADFDEATQTKFIKALELLEISIVTVPANARALFREVGSNLPQTADKPVEAPTPNEGEPANDPKSTKPAVTKVEMSDVVKSLVTEGLDEVQAISVAYKVCGEGKSCPTAESFKTLNGFIADVKNVLGEEKLDGNNLVACVDYFTKNEEIMTKEQLIAQLRQKSAPVPTPAATAEGNKDSAAPAAEKPAGESAGNGADLMKMVEACLARMDALSEAVAKLLEGKEEQTADPSKEEGKDGAEKPTKEDEGKEDEEMSDEEAEKTLAELESQIQTLEDEGND